MNYAAPLSRLARSRVHADPRPSPRLDRGRRNPFNLRAFCAAQCGETAQCNPLVSIAGSANWVNVLSRTATRLKSFPCTLDTVTLFLPPSPPPPKKGLNNLPHFRLFWLHRNK